MGAGKAEIRKNSVAHELGDEAVVARDRSRTGVLIGPDDLPHVFGIEPRRHRGGAHEVAEHDRKLATLRRVAGRERGRACRRRVRASGGRTLEFGDRRQQLSPVAEKRVPEFLQVKVRRISPSISLSWKAVSYCPRPRLRSQSPTSILDPRSIMWSIMIPAKLTSPGHRFLDDRNGSRAGPPAQSLISGQAVRGSLPRNRSKPLRRGTSVYSNKLTIVFLSWLPRTSRFLHTKGCACSCQASQKASMAWASSCVLLKLAPFKALRPRMPNHISI